MSKEQHEIWAEDCEEQYWPVFYKPFLQALKDLQDELEVENIRFSFMFPSANSDYEFTYSPINKCWMIDDLSGRWISSRQC